MHKFVIFLIVVLISFSTMAQSPIFEEALRLAEAGDPEAQLAVGNSYVEGIEVVKNDQEAAKWYRMAAEQGNVFAQIFLGHIYNSGRAVGESDQEGAKWIRLAAQQGDSFAQYYLGDMYEKGLGVVQNITKAYIWYSIATAKGDAQARAAIDRTRAQLSQQEIEQAQSIAKRCFDSDFKDCGE